MRERLVFPQSEDEAMKLAERLANELKETVGGDWKPKVWFNSWWCYSVSLGSIGVHESIYTGGLAPNGKMNYSAYINSEKGKTGGAAAFWSRDNNYSQPTPKEAVENAMKNATDIIAYYQATLDDNKKLMSE